MAEVRIKSGAGVWLDWKVGDKTGALEPGGYLIATIGEGDIFQMRQAPKGEHPSQEAEREEPAEETGEGEGEFDDAPQPEPEERATA